MKKGILWLMAAALMMAGCGGGGTPQANQLTRDEVAALLKHGVNGIANLPSPTAGPQRRVAGQHTRSLTAKLNANSQRAVTREVVDTYYNMDLELWSVDFVEGDPTGDHTWGSHYFVDEALTQPAGDDVRTAVWGSWPNVDDQDLKITAGPYAGYWMKDHQTLDGEGAGFDHAEGFVPGEGGFDYTMTWTDGSTATITAKYTALDESWVQYDAKPQQDGGNDYTITTSQGVKFHLIFDPVYAGTGTITGPSSVLPATLEWDNNGDGTIHWRDGSTTSFTNWDF